MTAEAVGADTILSVLRQLGQGPQDERATFGELVARLDERGRALLILLLAAPNLTPGPSMPGFSTIFGVPLCILAFEMILGRRTLRLPGFLARRTIARRRIAGLIVRLEPLLRRLERVVKPRGPVLDGPGAERGIGAACLVLSVLLTLPIPVFSLLPAAALVIIALGMLARDGLAIVCGLGLGLVSAVILIGLVVAADQIFAVG